MFRPCQRNLDSFLGGRGGSIGKVVKLLSSCRRDYSLLCSLSSHFPWHSDKAPAGPGSPLAKEIPAQAVHCICGICLPLS